MENKEIGFTNYICFPIMFAFKIMFSIKDKKVIFYIHKCPIFIRLETFNNQRKFKDRIALLNQKQAESTAQFQAVMRDVSEVKKPQPFPNNFEQGQPIGGEGLMIPRHLSPGLPTHHPHYRWVKRNKSGIQ